MDTFERTFDAEENMTITITIPVEVLASLTKGVEFQMSRQPEMMEIMNSHGGSVTASEIDKITQSDWLIREILTPVKNSLQWNIPQSGTWTLSSDAPIEIQDKIVITGGPDV